jgi:hypothetical protein
LETIFYASAFPLNSPVALETSSISVWSVKTGDFSTDISSSEIYADYEQTVYFYYDVDGFYTVIGIFSENSEKAGFVFLF